MADIKKSMMLIVWRFQQINSMIIIVGLSLTLTFQLYPYMSWRFVNLGIPAEWDWLIIIIIFFLIFTGAIFVGIIYDVILKLWIQQAIVTQERHPYAKDKINAKGIVNKQYYWAPMLRNIGLENEARFTEKWIELNMEDDPILRKDVNRIVAWINNYKLKPEDKRWLEELEVILNKPYAPKSKDVVKK